MKKYYFQPQDYDVVSGMPTTLSFLSRPDVEKAIIAEHVQRRGNEKHQRVIESEQPLGTCRCREGWHVVYPSGRDIMGRSSQALFCEPT